MKSGNVLERIGGNMPAIFPSGVLMVEVSKRVHAPSGPGKRLRVPSPLEMLGPKPVPEAAVGLKAQRK